jgi:hypothetical protein
MLSVSLSSTAVSAEDYLVSIGTPLAAASGAIVLSPGDRLLLNTSPHRSYSCEGIPSVPDSEFGFGLSVESRADSQPAIRVRATGNMAPVVTAGVETRGRARISFLTPGADRDQRYAIPVRTALESREVMSSVLCRETTLYGSYNLFAADYHFAEFENFSDAEISGYITAESSDGRIVLERHPFKVPGGATRHFDLHTVIRDAIGDRSFGRLLVVHNGPPNALTGRVARYNIRERSREQANDSVSDHSRAFELIGVIRLREALN